MARKRDSLIEDLILCPWWVSASGAGIVFFGGAIFQAVAAKEFPAFAPTIGLLRIGFVVILILISLKSFIRGFTTKRNLEVQSGIDSLKSLHWKEFENLMGEVFRREGYSVDERLVGGADGGVDLVLRQDGRRTLVQCKLRTRGSVGVPVVRELFGSMAAERAHSGVLVTTSAFTVEVHRFAADKPIRLIDGPELLKLVRSVQRSPFRTPENRTVAPNSGRSACPACGNQMVMRTARKGTNAGSQFWGCSAYPKCKKTVNC